MKICSTTYLLYVNKNIFHTEDISILKIYNVLYMSFYNTLLLYIIESWETNVLRKIAT